MTSDKEISVNYEQFKKYADKHGLDETLKYCQGKYPYLRLYKIERLWLEVKGHPCIAYGHEADLVINFERSEA